MDIKILGRCFSVALCCWSLLFSSLPLYAQSTNQKPLTAEECQTGPNSPYEWNGDLNRCMLKKDATAAREQFEKCNELEGEAQAKCLKDSRDKFMNEDSMEHSQYETEKLGTVMAGANGIVVAHALFQTIGEKAKEKTPGAECISRKILMGAGIASFVGELYLRFMVKDGFDKLSKEYEKVDDPAYDKQVAAFDYLEAEQKAIVEYAKKHEQAYRIYSYAYGAAAAMAGIELLVGTATMTPTPCYASGGDNPEDAGKDVETAKSDAKAKNKIANKKGASAADKEAATNANNNLDAKQDALGKASGFGSMFDTNMLGTSAGILSIGTISFLISHKLAEGAKREMEKAEKNANLVASARSKFEKTMAASSFCRSRDDLSQPRCYCYKSDGSRNTERTRSETCQALWGKHDRNLFAEATDYGGKNKKKAMGCYRIDGVYDPDCKCRQAKNEKGENACYKVPVSVNEIAMAGPGIGMPQVIDSMNQLYGGGLSTGQLSSGQISQNAARIRAAREQIADKVLADKRFSGLAPLLDTGKMIDALAKKLPKEVLTRSANAPSLAVASTPPAALKSALEQVRKDSGLPAVAIRGGRAAPSKKSKKVGFDIYKQEEDKATTAFMEKKYDYSQTQNDIVEREDVSIWQVISNRYTNTGLKRLFDDDAEGL